MSAYRSLYKVTCCNLPVRDASSLASLWNACATLWLLLPQSLQRRHTTLTSHKLYESVLQYIDLVPSFIELHLLALGQILTLLADSLFQFIEPMITLTALYCSSYCSQK
jgi:hypothetical protein